MDGGEVVVEGGEDGLDGLDGVLSGHPASVAKGKGRGMGMGIVRRG